MLKEEFWVNQFVDCELKNVDGESQKDVQNRFNRILEIEKLKNCDLIIPDGNGLNNIGCGHVGVNGSIEIFNLLKSKRKILTHLTHEMSYKDISAYVKNMKTFILHMMDGIKIIKSIKKRQK